MRLLNTSLLLALLPASALPLRHSNAWNLACRASHNLKLPCPVQLPNTRP